MKDNGLLKPEDLTLNINFPDDRVDYGLVINFKRDLLKIAYKRFLLRQELLEDFYRFVEENKLWLHDYAMFVAIKEKFDGLPWWDWPQEYKLKYDETINAFSAKAEDIIGFYKFCQYYFLQQWNALKQYANSKGISIIGDIPLYVAHDSADVWSNHEVFQFDENRLPEKVAGVPPDYFSETGQLWGNPIYHWENMKNNGFKWWIERVKATLAIFDIVRIDHFRGFEAFWAVSYGEETAINGEWMNAPGKELFEAIRNELGELPIIAEDLGIITPEVEELRDNFEFPGMKILQFAFHSDKDSGYLPHNYESNFIVYTGTHDNDTLKGWFYNLEDHIKEKVLEHADCSDDQIIKKMIRLAWSSVAKMAIIPLQDLLELGSDGRMNIPGTSSGNWQWRFKYEQLKPSSAKWLNHITKLYNR